MIFMDRVDITGKDGAAVGTNQMVYLAVPIKKTGTDVAGQMIIAGLTADPKDAPGPFGVYEAATSHRMTRSTNAAAGQPIEVDENWEFTAADGATMSIHVKYERGVARKGGSEVKFFSGKDPSVYQIFKIEQGIDIMRNATIPVKDHVKEVSYKASGGKFGGAVRRHRKDRQRRRVPLVQSDGVDALARVDTSNDSIDVKISNRARRNRYDYEASSFHPQSFACRCGPRGIARAGGRGDARPAGERRQGAAELADEPSHL